MTISLRTSAQMGHGLRMATMSLGLVAGLLLCEQASAQTIGAERLDRILTGIGPAFEGEQIVEINGPRGLIRTRVRIFSDGRGSVRREFLDGPAEGSIFLVRPDGSFTRGRDGKWYSAPNPLANATRASLILRNYDVRLVSAQRIAGRNAIRIEIEPKHAFNPSRHVTIDPTNDMTLRDVLYAPGGEVRSSSNMVRVSLGNQAAALFARPDDAVARPGFGPGAFVPRANAADVVEQAGGAPPRPSYLPPGYRLAAVGILRGPNNERRSPASRFTDGLSSITIVRRTMGRGQGGARPPRPGKDDREALKRRNEGNRPGREGDQIAIVTARRPGGLYILIGDIAKSELQKVADSLN